MSLTEYVLQILPQPQVAAATVRSVSLSAWTAVVGTVALWAFGDPIDEALRVAAIAAFVGTGSGRILLEGVFDMRRARAHQVKPWDVQ